MQNIKNLKDLDAVISRIENQREVMLVSELFTEHEKKCLTTAYDFQKRIYKSCRFRLIHVVDAQQVNGK